MIGKVGTADYLAAFVRECTIKDVDGIRANRLSVVGRERENVFAIAQQLQRAGIVCCILSNTIALHWEKLNSHHDYPSLSVFDRIFASHLVARAKPRRSAFSYVAHALKLRMSECLLVDDTPLNVDKAKAAGWRGFLFTDAVSFQHRLSTELTASDGAKA